MAERSVWLVRIRTMPTFSPQLAVPVGALGVLLALYCVWRLVQTIRKSFVSRMPLVERQTVNLKEAGSFAINLESPQWSLADFGLGPLTMKGSMKELLTGREVQVKRNLFGMTVKGFSRMRRPLFRFQLERPGSYELTVHGIPDRRGLDRCNLVFTRPIGAKVVPLILGIMAGMMSLILSIVLPAVTADPLRASVVDRCLDGSEAACEGLAAMADQRCSDGDAEACETLGLLKSQGRGTNQDLPHAAKLFERSCDAGLAKGCVNLGWALQNGLGVEPDADGAAGYFEKACDSSLGLGCHNLAALHYENGQNLQAVAAWERGCDLAYASSCHNLAAFLIQSGESESAGRARELYEHACRAGVAVSCQALQKL